MKASRRKTDPWRRRSIVSIAAAELSQNKGAGPTALRRPELREVVGDQLAVEQRQLAERSGGRTLGEDLVRGVPRRGRILEIEWVWIFEDDAVRA